MHVSYLERKPKLSDQVVNVFITKYAYLKLVEYIKNSFMPTDGKVDFIANCGCLYNDNLLVIPF